MAPDAADAAQQLPPELARLPRGRHGLPREFVEQNQRTRLIGGTIDAVAEHGYAATTIEAIVREAGVSRGSFYRHFANKEEAFAAAYDSAMDEVLRRFEQGFEAGGEWNEALAGGLRAMLSFLAANPHIARVALVEALFATPRLAERHYARIELLAPFLARGRSAAGAATLSPVAENVVLGGIFSLAARRVLAGETERLGELAPALAEFAAEAYLGAAAAPPRGPVAVG
jgi:AcrR family transcriptional regulator